MSSAHDVDLDDLLEGRLVGDRREILDRAVLGSAAMRADLVAQEQVHRLLRAAKMAGPEAAFVRRVMQGITGDPLAAANRVMTSARFLRQAKRRRRTPPATAPARTWLAAAGLVLGLAGLAGLGWWHGRQDPTTSNDDGISIVLAEHSDLVPGVDGRPALLRRGRAEVTVAPRQTGEPWQIASPHGLITVHGTRFTLTVIEEATRIDLHEGRIAFAAKDGLIQGPADLAAPASTYAIDPVAYDQLVPQLATVPVEMIARGARRQNPAIPASELPAGAVHNVVAIDPARSYTVIAWVHRPRLVTDLPTFRLWPDSCHMAATLFDHEVAPPPPSSSIECEVRLRPLGHHLLVDWFDAVLLVNGSPKSRHILVGTPSRINLTVNGNNPMKVLGFEVYEAD